MTWTRATATRRALALTVTVAVVALLPVASAAAHSDLVGSDPADGAVLEAAPGTVRLTFSEEVEPQFATVAITVGDGEAAEVTAQVQGADVIADAASAVTAGAEPGQPTPWVVAYRVVSADGHPITGTVSFTVTAPAASPPAQPTTTPDAPSGEPDPSPTATPSPSASPSETAEGPIGQDAAADPRGPGATAWVLAAAGVALVAALVAWLARRRGSSEP